MANEHRHVIDFYKWRIAWYGLAMQRASQKGCDKKIRRCLNIVKIETGEAKIRT